MLIVASPVLPATVPAASATASHDAEWLIRDLAVTIEPSGAYTIDERSHVRILTPRGLALAHWDIPYNTACETLSIIAARTRIDGKSYPLDMSHSIENAVYPGMAWYDSVVVRRLPLPAAAVGAVLQVETRLRRQEPRMPGHFNMRIPLQHQYPIRQGRVTIAAPVSMPVHVVFTGGITPTLNTSTVDETRTYTWQLADIPALPSPELLAPPEATTMPSAIVTTLDSWAPVAHWFAGITAGKDSVTDDLRTLAIEAIANCTTLQQKVSTLHGMVRDIPYAALELGASRDEPYDAEETARRNFGDCKDKAVLLRALLRAVGISSHYVLVRTTDRGPMHPGAYGPDACNHVILVVETPEGDLYLDPTLPHAPASQLPPGVSGADALIVRGQGERVSLPSSTTDENATTIEVAIAIQEDGSAKGSLQMRFHGETAIAQRGLLAGIAPDQYREAMEGYLAPRLGQDIAIESVTVAHLRSPEQPLEIAAQFSSPCYLQQAGDQWSGYLPSFAYQPNRFRTTKQRTVPFRIPSASSMQLRVDISLPRTYTVSLLPSPVSYRSMFGRYDDAVTATETVITYTCRLHVISGTFTPESLPDMRTWSGILALEGRNQLQFFLRRRECLTP